MRIVLAALLTVGGLALLGLGVFLGRTEAAGPMIALPVGVLGGTVSFIGVLVGAVLWVPRVVSLVGRLLAGTGPSARLAAANTLRNPRRTAATSAALLIGVTLVAMMSAGAASARATLDNELDAQFPVDVVVRDPGVAVGLQPMEPVLTADLVQRLLRVEGVAAAGQVTVLPVELSDAAGDLGYQDLRVAPAASARDLLLDPSQADGLTDGTVVVERRNAEALGLVDGDVVGLEVSEVDGPRVERAVVVTDFAGGLLVSPGTLDALGVDLPANELWLRLDDSADVVGTLDLVQAELSELPVAVLGAALERQTYQQVIDTLLAVVVGLLAAAVVIALIGVANTLSLSVIERRRESATLRAIGMSRGQLRASLAVEGVLIAGVGALLGSVLGVAYGWAGALTALGVAGDVVLELPWRDLGLVLAVAAAAGLLASVLPARSAVRTSPVEALAVE